MPQAALARPGPTLWKGPLQAPPDFDNLLAVLQRKVPQRPTLFEFHLNQRIQERLAGPEIVAACKRRTKHRATILRMHAVRNAGYDYLNLLLPGFAFSHGERDHKQTISMNAGQLIRDRASFEQYPWPDPEQADYGLLETLAAELEPGMKLVVYGPCGVLENANLIVGYENLCMLLADDEQLASDLFEAIGSRLLRYYQRCLECPAVGAILSNDDWGFKTQPMLAPKTFRRFVLPWHKRIVEAAHAAGRPAILHSCGNLSTLLDDIVDGLGYDAKHSYEDAILPVEAFYREHGHRIAVLGGLDLDFMVRATPEAVYERSQALLNLSAARGGYALGTGNSVPDYVPDENFLALLAAATAER